jgi:hypothetical protein
MRLKTLLATASVLMFVTAVSAQTGAGVSPGDANETISAGGPGSVTTDAGAVSQVDISQDTLTEKWAGFYGTVSGNLVLGDASGNNFYSWTTNDFSSSKVIAVPGGNATPTGIAPVSSPNTFLGSGFDSGTDDAAATYDQTGDITVNDDTAASTALAQTYDDTGTGTFDTYLVENTNEGNHPAYIAQGVSEQTGFDGTTQVNYQMIVGVGEDSEEERFEFYLEIS